MVSNGRILYQGKLSIPDLCIMSVGEDFVPWEDYVPKEDFVPWEEFVPWKDFVLRKEIVP